LHHGFDLSRLVRLTGCKTSIERYAVAITQEVDLGTEAANGAAECVVGRLIWPIAGIVRCARRGAVGTDNRPIQRPLLPIDAALRVEFDLERFENAVPSAIAAPERIAVVDRFPFAVAFGNIWPRRASMQSPENAIDNRPVRVVGMTGLPVIGWQFWLNQLVLVVAQVVASHCLSGLIMVNL